MMYLIQLPNDAVSVGYRQTKPFHHEQVFTSSQHGFTGTEAEFVQAGIAYRYIQLDNHSRVTNQR